MTTHTTEGSAFAGLLARVRDLYDEASKEANRQALACDAQDEQMAQFWRGMRDMARTMSMIEADTRSSFLDELQARRDSVVDTRAAYPPDSLDWWYYTGQLVQVGSGAAWAKRL